MNLRIGRFGRQEGISAVWVASFASGCFSFDSFALFHDGNLSVLSHLAASVLSLLLFACVLRAIRKRGGIDLSTLIGRSRIKAVLAAFLILFLLLCAVLPLRQFLLTIAQDIFADAKRENVCWYLLPCLLLLTMLGAETLVRTSRVLLPVLFLSVLAALAIGIREFRVFRMYPIPLGKPEKLLTDTVSAIQRTFAPLLALLCIGEGTQNTRALQSAGNIGAAFGTVTVLGMFLGLSFAFSYGMLADMPSPFYRMLVEARTENPTLRLDRAALFLWMAAAILGSALYLYAASVLFCRTFGVRDVRPAACCMSALAAALVLALCCVAAADTVVPYLYRDGWLLAVVPILLLCLRGKEKQPCAVCA